ncbi:MAG: L-lactate dehydrogenase [Roseiflexaceae bacterium]
MSGTATKVGIVGAGMVGSSCAYALMQRGVATEIVLVDADAARAEGEAMDLNHGVPFVRACRIRSGSYADLDDAAIVVIAAGANQRPGETRLDLLQRNAAIIRTIIPQIVAAAPEAVILMATNPVDVLAQIANQAAGLPHGRVIGSGTILDTARLRALLAEYYHVDPRSVHAYIIGEHGDSSLPVWSSASIGGIPLTEFTRASGIAYDPQRLQEIFVQARDAAYEIIKRKRATYYAIGLGLVTIIEAVLRNQHTVLTVSSPLQGQYGINGTCISLPSIVGRHGVEEILQLSLTSDELAAFQRSAALLAERYQQAHN